MENTSFWYTGDGRFFHLTDSIQRSKTSTTQSIYPKRRLTSDFGL
jgi:hypothetical protein